MFRFIILSQIMLMVIYGAISVTGDKTVRSLYSPGKQKISDTYKKEKKELSDTYKTGKHELPDTYKKGDGGIMYKSEQRIIKRDVSNERTQLPSNSENTSPFMSPVHTSYFMGQCLMCPPGSAGPRGPPGLQGQNGRDGRDGRDQSLYSLPPGDIEEPAPRVLNHTDVGVTYVRWGKTTCPSSSHVVYEGVMAGGKYNEKGGGANYLCLTISPVYDRPQAGIQFGTHIYGTEYEFGGFNAMPALYEQDVPCVVCIATSKHQALMIPGQNICPTEQDWTFEYAGFIMADHSSQERSEYICVDKDAEGIPRTVNDDNLSLIRPVEIKCGVNGGGLPCPPYVDGYELTCAVCTM